MKTVAIIDARVYSKHAQQPWGVFAHTLEAVVHKINPLVDRVILMGEGYELPMTVDNTAKDIFIALQKSVDTDDVLLYLYADEPLIDSALLQGMLAKHRRYHANYTFGEGFPKGIAPQIINACVLDKLIELASDEFATSREYIFDTIKREINFFDIETELSSIDLRGCRLMLNYQTFNNSLISNQLIDAGGVDWATLLPLITEKPELLWARPVYYNIQISSNCPQRCAYCPYPQNALFNTNTMFSLSQFKQLLSAIVAFSQEAVIGFNLAGEAALHPKFCAFMDAVKSYETLHLHIETSGLGWSEEAWQGFASFPAHRSSLIISLDSLEEVNYVAMRGAGFTEAMDFAQKATSHAATRGRTWLQCVRLKQNESSLEQFYRGAKKMTPNVIIQKYDDFAQVLPSLKSINIAPLVRRGCWALQREMSISITGDVYACKEDLTKEYPMGNVFTHSLTEIWTAMNKLRLAHTTGAYPSLCQKCDEYYVYNF